MSELARSLGRVGVWLSPRSLGVADAAATRAAAREIEELGYPSLWFAEGLRSKEAFTHASLLLAATDRLVVATGIAGIWARDAVAATPRRTRSRRRTRAGSCWGWASATRR